MTTYLGPDGKIIEKEGLEDMLEQQAPDLAASLDKTKEVLANTKAYAMSLYIMPHEEEINLLPQERKRWNNNINLFHAQYKLAEHIGLVESLKFVDQKNIGDKVLVLQSNRPFFDTVIGDHKLGEAKAWIGSLISNDLTNIPDAKFNSIDGKIYRRVELVNAQELSPKLIGRWATGEIERMYSRMNFTHESVVKDLKKMPLGNESVLMYDEYQNTDIYCVEHILSKAEKVADSVERPDMFSIQKQYWGGNKGWGRLWSNIGVFGSGQLDRDAQQVYLPILEGQDERSPEEIYMSIKEVVEELVPSIKEEFKTQDAHLFIAKHITHSLTKADEQDVNAAVNTQKMLKYKLLQEGMNISPRTVLVFNSYQKGHSPGPQAALKLYNAIQETLPQYKVQTVNMSYGFGSSYCDNQEISLTSAFFFEFDHFYGEYVRF
ncbi:MAG: hypothetical protein WC758_02800 [Candidatus Woesearchaeota archaeon]|jgi:hypothetical protein